MTILEVHHIGEQLVALMLRQLGRTHGGVKIHGRPGASLPQLLARYGREVKVNAALASARRLDGGSARFDGFHQVDVVALGAEGALAFEVKLGISLSWRDLHRRYFLERPMVCLDGAVAGSVPSILEAHATGHQWPSTLDRRLDVEGNVPLDRDWILVVRSALCAGAVGANMRVLVFEELVAEVFEGPAAFDTAVHELLRSDDVSFARAWNVMPH